MKKYILAICLFLLLANQSFAEVLDDSISKELEKNLPKKETITLDFKMKTYDSCEKIDEVLNKYFEIQRKKMTRREGELLFGNLELKSMSLETSNNVISEDSASFSSEDFATTNTQISGVDEAEIIKTDGKFIYYFSEKGDYKTRERFIQILSLDRKKIIKKIKIPEKISSVEFYLSDGKLVILGSLRAENFFRKNLSRSEQSYVIVYDVKNPEKLKLEKFFSLDGYYANSRLIGDKLYVISKNYFYNYNEDFSILKSLPEKIEANFNGKKYDYSKKMVSDCKNLEFILPEEKYFEKNNFNLSFDLISILDLKNLNKEVKTNVVVGNGKSEIFMNEKNLYLTSNIYNYQPLVCRGVNCLFPTYESRNLTLVNKFNIGKENINYQKSALVEGSPLTQYSMDEDKNGNFRILTQLNSWAGNDGTYVNFYILDKNLKLFSKLEKLGVGEEFKSSRYIGDKLFLVTFERTDPLFVIDLKNAKNPKILGELKIPGYSTYLHPYDENHLIGIGYDTKENEWGGVQSAGVKVDLYQINYDKKCGDFGLTKEEKEKCESGDYKGIIAKQLFTQTFGGIGSHSEALYNPRMFIWNSAKNKLFLPVELRDYKNENFENFFGLLALNIDKKTGIKKSFEVTSLDLEKVKKEFVKDCLASKGKGACEDLNKYLSNNHYKFKDSFINRALWVGENIFTFSPNIIKANNIDSGREVLSVELN